MSSNKINVVPMHDLKKCEPEYRIFDIFDKSFGFVIYKKRELVYANYSIKFKAYDFKCNRGYWNDDLNRIFQIGLIDKDEIIGMMSAGTYLSSEKVTKEEYYKKFNAKPPTILTQIKRKLRELLD